MLVSRVRHTPKVGNYLLPDGWIAGATLESGDDYRDNEFPGCEFRVLAGDGLMKLAINVEVTGGQHKTTSRYTNKARCQIEFVKDGGQESVYLGGWIYFDLTR